MNFNLSSKYVSHVKVLAFAVILIALTMIGLETRSRYTQQHLAINTSSFFYSRAHYLFTHGEYLKKDYLCFAPLVLPENYPPGLAYATVWSFNLTRWLHQLTFYEYAINFPIVMYVVILLTGFAIMSKLYSRSAGLIFAALLTVVPLANKLTYRCYYTTEAIGVLCYLLTIFFLAKLEEKPKIYSVLATLSLTGLMITWQLFIPLLAVIALLALMRLRRPWISLTYFAVIFGAFGLGYVICRWFVGIEYSPFFAVKEVMIGSKMTDTPDYGLVLGTERKIRPMDFAVYLRTFSWISIPLIAAGLIKCGRNLKSSKYFIPFLGAIFGMILVLKYIKFRFIALPFFLVVCGIGWDALWGMDWGRAWAWVRKKPKLTTILALVICASGYFAYNQLTKEKVQEIQEVAHREPVVIDEGTKIPQLTRAILEESLLLGKKFILNNQLPDGSFTYEYDFVSKKRILEGSQVRKAGALWALALVYRYQPTVETARAIERGLEFYDQNSVTMYDGRKSIHYPGEAKGQTGTVAMVVLTLVDYLRDNPDLPERTKYRENLDGYLKFLHSLRMHDGRYFSSYELAENRGYGDPSPFFDGEALLATVKAAKYMGYDALIPDIMTSAEGMYALDFAEDLRRNPKGKTARGFYHWGSMSFYEMFTAGWKGTEGLPGRVIDMAYWMVDVRKVLDKPRNTGYAFEGLVTAWKMAELAKNEPAMAKLRNVIDQGLYKFATWQVGSPVQNDYLVSHPTVEILAVGGAMNGKDDPSLRIDVTQHQMHAVKMALEWMD